MLDFLVVNRNWWDGNWFFCKLDSTFKEILRDRRVKSSNIKNNERWTFFVFDIDEPFSYWQCVFPLIYWCLWLTMLLILSKITLLILLIPDLEGLIKGQEILFGKSSFWSLIVMYSSFSCILFTLPYFTLPIRHFFVIFSEAWLMLNDFLKVLLTFNNFLYSSYCNIYVLLDFSAETKILLLFFIRLISTFLNVRVFIIFI